MTDVTTEFLEHPNLKTPKYNYCTRWLTYYFDGHKCYSWHWTRQSAVIWWNDLVFAHRNTVLSAEEEVENKYKDALEQYKEMTKVMAKNDARLKEQIKKYVKYGEHMRAVIQNLVDDAEKALMNPAVVALEEEKDE